jgi:hypothetical protein
VTDQRGMWIWPVRVGLSRGVDWGEFPNAETFAVCAQKSPHLEAFRSAILAPSDKLISYES